MKYALLAFVALSLVAGSLMFIPSSAGCGVQVRVPDDPAAVQKMIASYRSEGPNGLHALLGQYDISRDPRLLPIIDAVAGQRNAATSRLFWYTDLDQASAVATAEHKPILYLRLLGKLTDEYSCANSRFFRTVLYSNTEVSKLMREKFILVWISERPVPVVTIDYGDGRVLKRTITGNSIHYVLTPQGQVIDALPGLYDPKTFMTVLTNAVVAATRIPATALAKCAQANEQALRLAWQDDTLRANPQMPGIQVQVLDAAKNPDARIAMVRAVSKTKVEQPIMASIMPPATAAATDKSIESADDAIWQKIAAIHLADATLDASSIALIRSQNPQAYAEPGALEKTVARFQQNIAMDTVHNNYQLRRQILSWLRQSPGNVRVEDLNRRVYAELFLTPKADPWLGLVPEATYSALCEDGCTVVRK